MSVKEWELAVPSHGKVTLRGVHLAVAIEVAIAVTVQLARQARHDSDA